MLPLPGPGSARWTPRVCPPLIAYTLLCACSPSSPLLSHRFRAVDPVRESSARRAQLQGEALEEVRRGVEELAAAIGHGHMLVQGATRYYGQLSKLVR